MLQIRLLVLFGNVQGYRYDSPPSVNGHAYGIFNYFMYIKCIYIMQLSSRCCIYYCLSSYYCQFGKIEKFAFCVSFLIKRNTVRGPVKQVLKYFV